jgi:hypothetical protein
MAAGAIAALLALAVFLVAGAYWLFFSDVEIDEAPPSRGRGVPTAPPAQPAGGAPADEAERPAAPSPAPSRTGTGVTGRAVPPGVYRIVVDANTDEPRALSMHSPPVYDNYARVRMTFAPMQPSEIFDPAHGADNAQFEVAVGEDGALTLTLSDTDYTVTHGYVEYRDMSPINDDWAGGTPASRSLLLITKKRKTRDKVDSRNGPLTASPFLDTSVARGLGAEWGRAFGVTSLAQVRGSNHGWLPTVLAVSRGTEQVPLGTNVMKKSPPKWDAQLRDQRAEPKTRKSGSPIWFIRLGDVPVV